MIPNKQIHSPKAVVKNDPLSADSPVAGLMIDRCPKAEEGLDLGS